MKIINAKQDELVTEYEDTTVSYTLYSHESLSEPGKHQVTLFLAGHGEIGCLADTRGEAMLMLAGHFDSLARKLKMMAFEQEGALPARVLTGERRPR